MDKKIFLCILLLQRSPPTRSRRPSIYQSINQEERPMKFKPLFISLILGLGLALALLWLLDGARIARAESLTAHAAAAEKRIGIES